jgi:tetratricopeptide (TPR) repeat protein
MRLKALLPLATSNEVLAQVMRVTEAELSRLSAQLEAASILREGGFVHPLYRELLKRELTRDERQRLAGQIVEAFATTEPEMAAPYVADAGLRGEVALDILERAATEAERHGRERQAGEFLASAATYASGVKKRELLLRAARLLHVLHPSQAQRLTERVLEAEPHHLEASLLLARSLVRQGEGERAEALMQSLPEELRPIQRWFDELISLRTERCDYRGAVDLWLSRPELQGTASVSAKRDAATSLMNQGTMAEADALLSRALEDPALSVEERASLLEVRGSLAFYTGKYQDSLCLLDEVIALFRELSGGIIPQRLMYALRFRTMVYWGLCRLREAVRDTEEAMRLASDLGSGRDYAIAQTYLGVSLTELGEYERAEDELLEAREVLLRSDAREHLAACEAMLCGLYFNWPPEGRAAQALRYGHRSLSLTRELGAPMLICQATTYTSYAESAFGSAERALALAQETLDIGTQFGQRRVMGTGYWVRGLALERLGKHEDALRDFAEGERLLEEVGLPGLATYVGLDAARLRDDWESARKHVQRLRELGVVGYTLPARQHFASLFESTGEPASPSEPSQHPE